MKKITFLLFALLALNMSAQDLTLPSTPAFSILDYEPSSVMRPSSWKKLSADVLNSFDQDGKLQMNLGLEVMPYWLRSRPDLTEAQYLDPDVWQTVKQTFSLSVATVKDTVTNTNNLGAGFRFQLAGGELPEEYAAENTTLGYLSNLLVTLTAMSRDGAASDTDEDIDAIADDMATDGTPQSVIDEMKSRAQNIAAENGPLTTRQFVLAIRKSYEKDHDEQTQKVRELINKRVGFKVEVAGASKFVDQEGKNAFNRGGLWVNVSNFVSLKDAFTFSARLMAHTSDTTSVNTDAGLSYTRQEKDFNVSVEGMLRWYRTEIPDFNQAGEAIIKLDKKFTYRVAAQFSYTFTEDISVNLSFGKDFDSPVIEKSGMFSLFGLNYTLFKKDKDPD